MELKPAQLLRMIQMGQREAVLSSPAIWLCVGCDACGTRCPNQIRLGPMFDALRQMALEEEYAPEPSVYALHRSFLDSIRMWGRVHEMTMLAEYKMRCLLASPALFLDGIVGDMKMGGDLMVKGKLSFIPERVKNVGEVRKLYEGTKEHGPEEEGPMEEES
jgi:heterodisulfide reductase subunit C